MEARRTQAQQLQLSTGPERDKFTMPQLSSNWGRGWRCTEGLLAPPWKMRPSAHHAGDVPDLLHTAGLCEMPAALLKFPILEGRWHNASGPNMAEILSECQRCSADSPLPHTYTEDVDTVRYSSRTRTQEKPRRDS
ncbi:Hypothetical predicted protein [Pelobates cultripes]|uniref:Uncharacterized protein n=1 Tax=Pelobates cultripes TaxID=61616 RepID=A0AAD1SFC5_PELCU|nr:Hypothetical predicted protein [Pelobates cultripes]